MNIVKRFLMTIVNLAIVATFLFVIAISGLYRVIIEIAMEHTAAFLSIFIALMAITIYFDWKNKGKKKKRK